MTTTTHREVFLVGSASGLFVYLSSSLIGDGALFSIIAAGVGSMVGLFIHKLLTIVLTVSFVYNISHYALYFIGFLCILASSGGRSDVIVPDTTFIILMCCGSFIIMLSIFIRERAYGLGVWRSGCELAKYMIASLIASPLLLFAIPIAFDALSYVLKIPLSDRKPITLSSVFIVYCAGVLYSSIMAQHARK